jgi:hypothetical protein
MSGPARRLAPRSPSPRRKGNKRGPISHFCHFCHVALPIHSALGSLPCDRRGRRWFACQISGSSREKLGPIRPRRPWGCVCVRDPPPLRVFSSGLRSEACLFRSFLMVPLQTEPPLLPPKSQKRIYQRFFPWIPGENDVPGSSGRPGVAAQLQAQSPAPVLFFRQPHPRQASRPPPACPPPRRPGACDVAGFRWRGKGRVLFFSSGQKGLGAPQIAQTPAWLLGCAPVTWPEPSCTGF